MFQYNQAPFKVAAFFSWIVVLSDHDHMEELRRAPGDTVSFEEAAVDASLAFLITVRSICSMSPTRIPDCIYNEP